MKHEDVIVELQDAARQLGVNVRFEKGDFEGGFCLLRTERVVLVNKRLLPARRASVLAQALHEVGLENVFLKPAVREYIEDEVARALRASR